MNIWDVLKNITKNKSDIDWPSIEKAYKPFIINRCLSRDKTLVRLVNKLNTHDIPPENQYQILMRYIARSNRFYKFPSVEKEEQAEKLLNILKEFYSVKRDVAIFYLRLLKPNEIEAIYKEYEDMEKINGRKQD